MISHFELECRLKPGDHPLLFFGANDPLGDVDVLALTDTMTQSEGTKKIGAPARDRGSGLRQ